MNDPTNRLLKLMEDISSATRRAESLQIIAKEELFLALESLDDKEIERVRQKMIDVQTANLDEYIKNGKELHKFLREQKDAAFKR